MFETIAYIIITLIFSAYSSGMEIAFVSSNKLRFELDKKQGSLSSVLLSVFYRHPQRFISTMLVSNNIALVVYGLLMAELFSPLLAFMGNQFLITFSQTVIATIIVLLTGEFLPKTVFRINPNGWLRTFAPVTMLIYVLLYPVSTFSSWLSVIIMRIFGSKISAGAVHSSFSRIDLDYLLQETFENPENEKEIDNEVKIFQNALDFSKVKLRDCCIPRTEIIALEYSVDINTLKETFIETGLSKIPVYKNDIDNIIGYIHASEMFEHQNEWRNYINKIPIVPENMAAQKLMRIFMKEKKSIAAVVDEFGGTAGIVTLEDIFEEIFGEIEDEHDRHDYIAECTGDNEFLFSGRLEVRTANRDFELSLPESDDYETIAGFILYHHQSFPKLNEIIKIENLICRCVKVTNNRIELVKITVSD